MATYRICLCQIDATVGGIKNNADKIISYLRKSKNLNADIVCFPELSLSGYPPEDLLFKPHFLEEVKSALKAIQKESDSLTLVGLPFLEEKEVFNACAVIQDKKIVDIYKKMLLPNYGVFDERRHFFPGTDCTVYNINNDFKMAINICEDSWSKEGPQSRQAISGGANLVINISASPFHSGKINEREIYFSKRTKENKCYFLYCNLVGGQDELVFDGGSFALDEKGKITARAEQFTEDILTIDVDSEKLKKATSSKSKKIKSSASNRNIKHKTIRFNVKSKTDTGNYNIIKRKKQYLEEIYEALLLGFKDYVFKNNFKKVVIGLSGGIDSALTACIAVSALGKENVVCISMPSRYSSIGTKKDAEKIANNLGVKFLEVPIWGIYTEYIKELEGKFKNMEKDVTEENLQARIRGNILMAFSNKYGWLVLTTGNKSEVSTGYCTLYGDMAGGFSLLKDVPKTLVYKLSGYVNKKAGKDLIPKSVIDRAPSAELRENQKDQDSLPPYDVLDKILDFYVEKDFSVDQIVEKGYSRNIVKNIILKVDKNEYKRRQAPPGIKITPKALGKDRRMPITNRFFKL